jgi:hypothetical protein
MGKKDVSPVAPARVGWLRRAVQVLRGQGLRGLASRLDERRRRRFRVLVGYIIAYPVTPDDPIPQAGAVLTVDRVSPGDRAAVEAIVRIDPGSVDQAYWNASRLLARLEEGEICYAGRVSGQIIAAVWIQPEGLVVEFGKALFALRADEVYYKDAVVDPRWRGKKIYPAMKAITGRAMAAAGKRSVLSFVRKSNTNSLNASRKVGCRRAGYIGYIVLFGRRFPYHFRHPPIAL